MGGSGITIEKELRKKGYTVIQLRWGGDGTDYGWKAELTEPRKPPPFPWWEYLGPNSDAALDFIRNHMEDALASSPADALP